MGYSQNFWGFGEAISVVLRKCQLRWEKEGNECKEEETKSV